MRFTLSCHIIALIALIAASALAMPAMGQRTTRRGLQTSRMQAEASRPAGDTILVDADSTRISIAGFDKPLRSGVESLFVTNRTERNLQSIEITIDYFDLSGRKLHSRTLSVDADVPAGETRQVAFRTWDRQQSFYYRRSTKPRRADGTQFDVAVTLRRAVFKPLSETSSQKP